MKLIDILQSKDNKELYIVEPDVKLLEAVHILCEKRVGALLVLDAQKAPVGIVTERDVLWEVHRNSHRLEDLTVGDAMTRDLICGLPEDKVEYVRKIMTQNKIRHLPVVEGHKLIGIISVGDVIKHELDEARVENHRLQDYLEQAGQI